MQACEYRVVVNPEDRPVHLRAANGLTRGGPCEVRIQRECDVLARYPKLYKLPDGGPVCIRPITPEDAQIEEQFIETLSSQSRYMRFQCGLNRLTPAMLEKFTHNHYPRDFALVATFDNRGEEREIGVARFAQNEQMDAAEFAIVIADHWQAKGLGEYLMLELIDLATRAGYQRLEGQVLEVNYQMRSLAEKLGFQSSRDRFDEQLIYVHKNLGKLTEEQHTAGLIEETSSS